MEIKIFGPGCAKCMQVEKLVKEAAAAKGGNIRVRKVSDFKDMMAAGVLFTPAVAIDGIVKASGRVPCKDEIEVWIDEAAES